MGTSNEAEAVRTTIVGGRPPGSGRSNVAVPRGIEVLVKKAAVDGEFRQLLLAQRGRAATSIELELDPAESAMLSAIPEAQLARIVDQTVVGTELRSAFMGRAAAVMLAALGAGLTASPAGAQPGTPAPAPPASQAQPAGSASQPPFVVVVGATITPPTNPPPTNDLPHATNVAPLIPSAGVQPILPVAGAMAPLPPPTNPAGTNAPGTNQGSNPPPFTPIRGLQANPPPMIIAGLMVPVPPPTNAPTTNAVPPTNAPGPGAGVQSNPPVMVVFGLMTTVPTPPKPPESNPPDTNAPPKTP